VDFIGENRPADRADVFTQRCLGSKESSPGAFE
jgi:hypothetical protein